MSECNFSIPFTGTAEEVYGKAKAAVEKQGGSFSGDQQQGSFDVALMGNRIAGDYIVAGQDLQVSIHEKPFFVPCNAIESFLSKQLA